MDLQKVFATYFVIFFNDIIPITHKKIVIKRSGIGNKCLFYFDPLSTLNFSTLNRNFKKWLNLYRKNFRDFLLGKKKDLTDIKVALDSLYNENLTCYQRNIFEYQCNCERLMVEPDFNQRARLVCENKKLEEENIRLDNWTNTQYIPTCQRLKFEIDLVDWCIRNDGNITIDLRYNNNPQNKLLLIELK